MSENIGNSQGPQINEGSIYICGSKLIIISYIIIIKYL